MSIQLVSHARKLLAGWFFERDQNNKKKICITSEEKKMQTT